MSNAAIMAEIGLLADKIAVFDVTFDIPPPSTRKPQLKLYLQAAKDRLQRLSEDTSATAGLFNIPLDIMDDISAFRFGPDFVGMFGALLEMASLRMVCKRASDVFSLSALRECVSKFRFHHLYYATARMANATTMADFAKGFSDLRKDMGNGNPKWGIDNIIVTPNNLRWTVSEQNWSARLFGELSTMVTAEKKLIKDYNAVKSLIEPFSENTRFLLISIVPGPRVFQNRARLESQVACYTKDWATRFNEMVQQYMFVIEKTKVKRDVNAANTKAKKKVILRIQEIIKKSEPVSTAITHKHVLAVIDHKYRLSSKQVQKATEDRLSAMVAKALRKCDRDTRRLARYRIIFSNMYPQPADIKSLRRRMPDGLHHPAYRKKELWEEMKSKVTEAEGACEAAKEVERSKSVKRARDTHKRLELTMKKMRKLN
jgi:hypothetical protein